MSHFVFPKWTNTIRLHLTVGVVVTVIYVTLLVAYGASPKTTDVGYAPEQPIPYSHRLHVGELGLDCRYCHTTVDSSPHASVPPTQTCINCHEKIHPESEKLAPLRESYASGMPVKWVRVHDLPDYAYFNHSAHVQRGVGCMSCHGRVDKMEVVYQDQTLSMGWCLDCHRNPEPHLRPPEEVTNMTWNPTGDELKARFPDFVRYLDTLENGSTLDDAAVVKQFQRHLRIKNNINPSTDCSTCHR